MLRLFCLILLAAGAVLFAWMYSTPGNQYGAAVVSGAAIGIGLIGLIAPK